MDWCHKDLWKTNQGGVVRNQQLIDLLCPKGGEDTNFSRSCVNHKKDCPQCGGKMYASHLDREAVYEQLEEFMCDDCKYVETKLVGWPRFMNRTLLASEGISYYNENRPY